MPRTDKCGSPSATRARPSGLSRFLTAHDDCPRGLEIAARRATWSRVICHGCESSFSYLTTVAAVGADGGGAGARAARRDSRAPRRRPAADPRPHREAARERRERKRRTAARVRPAARQPEPAETSLARTAEPAARLGDRPTPRIESRRGRRSLMASRRRTRTPTERGARAPSPTPARAGRPKPRGCPPPGPLAPRRRESLTGSGCPSAGAQASGGHRTCARWQRGSAAGGGRSRWPRSSLGRRLRRHRAQHRRRAELLETPRGPAAAGTSRSRPTPPGRGRGPAPSPTERATLESSSGGGPGRRAGQRCGRQLRGHAAAGLGAGTTDAGTTCSARPAVDARSSSGSSDDRGRRPRRARRPRRRVPRAAMPAGAQVQRIPSRRRVSCSRSPGPAAATRSQTAYVARGRRRPVPGGRSYDDGRLGDRAAAGRGHRPQLHAAARSRARSLEAVLLERRELLAGAHRRR